MRVVSEQKEKEYYCHGMRKQDIITRARAMLVVVDKYNQEDVKSRHYSE